MNTKATLIRRNIVFMHKVNCKNIIMCANVKLGGLK
jgi:hypothetical protein